MKVLVPFDGSEPSKKALQMVIEQFGDAEFHVLHVLSVMPGILGPPRTLEKIDREEMGQATYERLEKWHSRGQETLSPANEIGDQHQVDIQTTIWFGRVGDRILEYANENDIDLIAIGAHSEKPGSRMLLGSVAEKVSQRSPKPVLIVR